jgi:hypothetical protein
MSFDEASRSDPTITHVGGGPSARLATLVVALLLGIVFWIGVSGRSPGAPGSTAAAVVGASGQLLEPTATVPGPTSSPSHRPSKRPVPLRPIEPLGPDKFAMSARVGEGYITDLLDEIEPGRLVGRIRIPFPRPATVARLELVQLWTREDRKNHVPIERWRLPLDHLTPETRMQGILLDIVVDAKPNASHAPRPVQLGYALVVRAESRLSFGVVTFELSMGDAHT